MATHHKGSQKRLFIALTLFFASICASIIISLATNKSEDYWVLTHPLPSGAVIERSDLELKSALLSIGNSNYLQSGNNPLGMVTSRALRSGELLSQFDVKDATSEPTTAQVAISMQSSDIPTRIAEGDLVSIYQIFESRNGEAFQSPKRILMSAYVASINREDFKFGGEATVTLAISENQIENLLASKSAGRLVMIATYG